jgi:hypothetical protein
VPSSNTSWDWTLPTGNIECCTIYKKDVSHIQSSLSKKSLKMYDKGKWLNLQNTEIYTYIKSDIIDWLQELTEF